MKVGGAGSKGVFPEAFAPRHSWALALWSFRVLRLSGFED